MNLYFIDYENVHADGFSGAERLREGDVVCVLYTDQSRNITLDVIEKVAARKAVLELYKAGTGGKNSLDFQLSTYLGYVIAQHEQENVQYYIVSKDTGFDKVVEFWAKRGVRIGRVINLAGLASKENVRSNNGRNKPISEAAYAATEPEAAYAATEPETAPEADAVKKAEPPATKKTSGKKTPPDRLATKEDMLRYLSPEEYTDRILEIFNTYKSRQAINNGLSKEFKDSRKSSAIYKKLKGLIKEKGKS